ncbi:hypothetical protein [Anaerocolumna sp. MB42-C2]|uniref:hypothetical protein n=1 Tax=Anaerocolumna sp. MB42-C2 TaxID=3070997 RepID=UPI0027E0462F|nr:hypothetical protein [Anaerocolumna sp. MB42-C2]WMJ86461.1 hypothetical protein RBU59_20835 [Anaerocolumna sp. MB42-C2]
MRKTLNLGYYDRYFSGDELNCIDQPIAALSDYIKKENYFFYAFYSILFSNWNISEKYNNEDFIDKRNYILTKFGLEIKREVVNDSSQFLKAVISKIDKDIPVFLLLRRKSLVYDIGDVDSTHGVVISGYDNTMKKILLRDAPHVEQSGATYEGQGYGLFKLWLREDLLLDMWEESNKIHNPKLANCLYVIIQNNEPKIKNYYDMFSEFLSDYGFKNNVFTNFLKSKEFNLSNFADDEYSRNFRRWLILPKRVIVDIIKRGAIEMNIQKSEDINKIEKNMIIQYSEIINMLCIYSKRARKITNEKLESIISDLNEIDIKLQRIVEEIILK